jgi:hypothetical protein
MRGVPAAAAPRAALLSVLLYAAALLAPAFPAHGGAALLLFGWHEMFAWRAARICVRGERPARSLRRRWRWPSP